MRHVLRAPLVLFLVLLTAAACEGPVGPQGPAGPQGPQGPEGPPGPGTRITFEGNLDASGEASVLLPAEAGSLSDPPAIACYISEQGNVWFTLAFDTNSGEAIACVWRMAGSQIEVQISNSASGFGGWLYKIVVVY